MLTQGTRVGPYEILAPAGAGGMGEVYKANDIRLNRTVAIKVLPDRIAADPALKQRFELEAKAVSSLNHPHICTLYDVGHQDPSSPSDHPIDFLVLEYLDGETLAQRLEHGGRLPIAHALTIAIQIAGALDQAHRAGIVHRDLKPANVFLVRKGGASGEPFGKLLDFGLAKSAAPAVTGSALSMLPTTPAGVTVQGAILGTFQYMAPEQIEGIDADARTDIFSFGLMLFEMLTGRTAFEGKTRASLLGAILKDVPPAVSHLRPDAPATLDRIVATCLAKEPDDRWQTARDLMRELQWVADSRDEQPARRAATPTFAARRHLPWLATMATLVAVVALAIAAARYWRPGGEDSPLMRLEMSTPPTTDSLSFALSPDGTKIVFVATSDGHPRLWLRAFDASAGRPLERTDGAAAPFWSPDSRSVAFFADRTLKRIDIDGGSVQTLAASTGANGGAWGPDGTIVFTAGPASGLSKVSSLGGTVSRVTTVENDQQGHRNPELLADGRHLLLYVRGDDNVRGIYVTSLDGLNPRRLLDSDTAPPVYVVGRKIFFVRQATLFEQDFDPDGLVVSGAPRPLAEQVGVSVNPRAALSVSRDGLIAYRTAAADSRRQFVWVDRSGHTLQTVGPPDVNRVWSPQLSPDGLQVAMHRGTAGNVDIYMLDVRRGLLTRATSDPANELQPIWSPDGARFAFAAFREGAFELRLRTIASREEESLGVKGFPVDWSSNGNFLLYAGTDARDDTGALAGRLWALPMDQRKPIPVADRSRRGQFSPDGRWVAFESAESGEMEVYVQAFPKSDGKIRVSVNGGAQPRWSADGTELFYVALDERLMAVPMGKRTNGTIEPSAPSALFSTRIGGAVQDLTSASYMVARDGRFLMNMLLEEERTEPIRFILNRKRN